MIHRNYSPALIFLLLAFLAVYGKAQPLAGINQSPDAPPNNPSNLGIVADQLAAQFHEANEKRAIADNKVLQMVPFDEERAKITKREDFWDSVKRFFIGRASPWADGR